MLDQPGDMPAGGVEDVVFRLGSDGFNLATRSGALSAELTAESAALVDPQLAKLVRGPIKITAPLTLTETDLKADPIEISSGAIGGRPSCLPSRMPRCLSCMPRARTFWKAAGLRLRAGLVNWPRAMTCTTFISVVVRNTPLARRDWSFCRCHTHWSC